MRRTTTRAVSRSVLAAAVALCAVVVAAGQAESGSRGPGVSRPPGALTFNKDVAPIVFQNCAACHHPGGSGPFSLLGYEDVRKHAKQIALVTESRYMPPWLPEPGYAEFADERRLSDDQIETIRKWVEQGAAEGAPADLPAAPKFDEGWQLGQPDLVVTMPQAYTLQAEGADVFRNFVIPVPVPATRYVKAVEILPGDKKLVHHANILIDRTQSSRRRDERDPEVGFAGMDVVIESDSFEPDSHFLFWKPGTVPWSEPDGMAWRLDPGTDLVLNMHLQPSGKRERIQPSVGIYFADGPPTAHPILLQLENDGAIDIPAGAKDFVVTDELVLPSDVDVLGVYPHAHYLGKDLQGVATLPDGTTKWLVRIKRWDLNWQAVYRYAKPIFLPKGTTVTMRYSYDNSAGNERNPSRPPRRVVAGDKSTDEMGHLWIQVLPRAGADAQMTLHEASMRRRLQKYPADFTANFNLGAALQSAGKLDEAVDCYRAALRARPDDVTALNSIGTAFQQLGKLDEAIGSYRRAVELKPDYANARYNLGTSLLALGKPDEAVGHLREVVRLQPGDAKAYMSLGGAFAVQGDLSGAAANYEQAIRVDPENAEAHSNLGYVFAVGGDLARAVTHYEQALRLEPENADTHNELGVVLARQGNLAQAVVHFEEALRLNPDHATARANLNRARAHAGKSGTPVP